MISVGVIGGFGAVLRMLVDRSVSARVGGPFPWGILAVNLSGSFALGLLVGLTADIETKRLLATGLLGSFTTFSTWMFDSRRLGEAGESGAAVANIAVSLAVGIALAWIGKEVGQAL